MENFNFNDAITSFSGKLSSSVIELASENNNQNSSSSDNEALPDSPIKQKCKRRCIQVLRAEECSDEEPTESCERKLDTVETGRNNEADSKTKSCNSLISEMYLALQQNQNWRSS